MMLRAIKTGLLLLVVVASAPARAHEPDSNEALAPVLIEADRPLSAASDQEVRNRDFMAFPRSTASDLLRFVPGLHITQHTGGAKAHQFFLRGFDAEHGQDVAVTLDGIPLNEPSHVHGAGYLDLHFLLPEVLERIWVLKGPYDARFGNFATAGVIDFRPYRRREFAARVTGGAGTFASAEGLVEAGLTWPGGDTWGAVQGNRTDGATDPGRQWAGRAFLHHRMPLGPGELRLLYAGYRTGSEAADILPEALIDAGTVSRFGALDDSNRVDVERHLLGLTWDWSRGDAWMGRVQAYANAKRTSIFSNYSFYYLHPETGDQMEQRDERVYAGMNTNAAWLTAAGGLTFATELGLQGRTDVVDQRQVLTQRRERIDGYNRYEFVETALAAYLDERVDVTRWLRLVAGVRLDTILWDGDGTQDRYGELDIVTNTSPFLDDDPVTFSTWGYAVSPKASAIFTPLEGWSLFLNFGRGFVSPYARQVAWAPDRTLPAVTGAEVGSSLKLWGDRISLATTGWWADKEAELVFDSEVGATIPRGRSRRFGAELEARVSPLPWLWVGTDLYWVRARFVDGNTIPNQAAWMMTNTVALAHPDGFKGTLRGRFVGPRTLDLGYTSAAYYVVDAQVGYETGPVELTLEVLNLLGAAWYDSVFAYASRPFRGGEVLEGVHVTPGTPTAARLRATVTF